jgi:hypothetical protein
MIRSPSSLLRVISMAALLLEFAGQPARALILYGSPGGHTVAPGNGAPWDNVGSVNGATGIYLGSFTTGYWVLTANHVGAGTITLAGNSYTVVGGSAVQLNNSGIYGLTDNVDLKLFRISADPMLGNLNLASTTPIPPNTLTMVGFGGGTKNWGTNTREGSGVGTFAVGGTTPNLNLGYATDYDPVTGEAQGTSGDSGGAVFFQSSGTWVLGGVMNAVDGVPRTFISDIATYRSLITAVTGSPIPEPATTGLIGGAAILCFTLGLRGRRRGRAG